MTGDQTRYEVTEIKAIRGTESRTIASRQQEGWELVDRQEGLVRTTMTFRRPKPKPPWRLWAVLGGVGVILAGIITVGALTEDDAASTTDAAAASSSEQPSPQPAPEQEAGPSPAADPMICETGPLADPCKFGQTAIYSDTVRSGDVRLEITVGAPVEFTPSEDAWTLYDRPLQPVTLYFPVTITNTSPDLLETLILTHVANAEQGESSTQSVNDGDIGRPSVSGGGYLPLGESLGVKDGWAMATLDGIEYSLSIDGLSGYTIEFTR